MLDIEWPVMARIVTLAIATMQAAALQVGKVRLRTSLQLPHGIETATSAMGFG
jgi:hypothetical protein